MEEISEKYRIRDEVNSKYEAKAGESEDDKKKREESEQKELIEDESELKSSQNFTRKHYSVFGFSVPQKFNRFGTQGWYMLWFCSILFFKSMVMNSFINVSLASLERRYKLSSTESAMIVSMYDIGSLVVVLPVSYYGHRSNKPMWVGLGAFVMGIGSLLYASPYAMSGFYQFANIDSKEIILCTNSTYYNETCQKITVFSKLQNFKYVFYLSQFITGCGSAPSYTLGFTFIEEMNTEGTAAFYIAIVTAVIAVSSAFGYGLSSIFLNIYVDIRLPSKHLTPHDTDIWIGAWWIGFLISGFGQMLLSLPLIWFPTVVVQRKVKNENTKMLSSLAIFDFLKLIKSLIINPTYLCICLATTLTLFATSGSNSYGPKYLEIVFGVTSSLSSMLAGGITLPPLLLGALLGGVLLKKYNWKIHDMLIYMSITCFISTPIALVLLVRCNDDKMAGVNTFYKGTNSNIITNLTSPCNLHCNCSQSTTYYRPVCGPDSINYFSPCFAGCEQRFEIGKKIVFKDCSCVTSNDEYPVTSKRCAAVLCNAFYVYLPMLACLFFITYMRVPPSITATMRSVRYEEKSIALGFRSIINRVLGSLPGPIVFGSIIDKTCILWAIKCKEKGNCLKYNSKYFTYTFSLWLFVSNLLTGIFFILPIFMSKSKCFREVL